MDLKPQGVAMLIETLTGINYTPEDACKWSMDYGYKALNQGTYYSYFELQFAVFGIACKMLNWQNTYGKPEHGNHEKKVAMLEGRVLCHRPDGQGPVDHQRPLRRVVVAGWQGADQ